MGLFNSSSEKIEYIVGLIFRQNEGVGLLLKINSKTKEIEKIDERMFKFSNAWENLVYDVDELLFSIENDHKIKLKKSIFFVYAHLVDRQSGEISPSYSEKLQEITKQNDLECLGYAEYNEVLARYLQEKEQTPLTSIVVEIDSPAVSAFIYKGGELVFSDTVAKTGNLTSDLEEIFSRSNKNTILPARMIMYDSSDLEKESSQILTHNWPDNLFIQLPKVEILNSDEVTEALVLEFKEQLFGQPDSKFFGKNILNKSETQVLEEEKTDKDALKGFVIGEDIREQKENITETLKDEQEIESETSIVEEPEAALPAQKSLMPAWLSFDFLKSKFFLDRFKIPQINIFKGGVGNKKLLLALAGFVLIGVAIFSLLYFFHKATLSVFYESKKIEKNVDISEGLTIEKSTETITEKASISTTGSKNIGEKANGEITIFNAGNEIVFEKGTELKTEDNLVFTLDQDVTAAGAQKTVTDEGDILTTTSKTKAQITATEIGTKYNIKNDVKLTIEESDATTHFARTNQAFSGGSSKKVRTASREDFDGIDKEIKSKINKKSSASLKKMSAQKNIIKDLTEIEIIDETYSKEVAEEADILELEVKAQVTYYFYDDNQLKDILIKELETDVPSNYSLNGENINAAIIRAEKDDETGDVSMTVEAVGEPKFNIDEVELRDAVRGKRAPSGGKGTDGG